MWPPLSPSPSKGTGSGFLKRIICREALALCRKYGSLFIADEVQTGLGRTGKWWAVEHFGVEPDLLCMAKALSGGFVPVGAVACRPWIFEKVFNRMDRAVVHGSTFGKNNLAMAAGLATLEVLETEGWIDHAAQMGDNCGRFAAVGGPA
jgi:ornithine--oxo-acid transaminase